jgi:hypothetical protein
VPSARPEGDAVRRGGLSTPVQTDKHERAFRPPSPRPSRFVSSGHKIFWYVRVIQAEMRFDITEGLATLFRHRLGCFSPVVVESLGRSNIYMREILRLQWMGIHLLPLLLVFGIGCGTVRVARSDNWSPATTPKTNYNAPNDSFSVPSPATTPVRETVVLWGWGWKQQNQDTTNCACGALAEVKVSTNLAFELASVLTLGFFQFETVEWRCAKQPQNSSKDF